MTSKKNLRSILGNFFWSLGGQIEKFSQKNVLKWRKFGKSGEKLESFRKLGIFFWNSDWQNFLRKLICKKIFWERFFFFAPTNFLFWSEAGAPPPKKFADNVCVPEFSISVFSLLCKCFWNQLKKGDWKKTEYIVFYFIATLIWKNRYLCVIAWFYSKGHGN